MNTPGQPHEYELRGKGKCASGRAASRILRPGVSGRSQSRAGRRQSAPLRSWTASDKPKAVQPGERPGSLCGRQPPQTTVTIEQNAVQERRKQRECVHGCRRDGRALYGPSGALKLTRSPEGPRIQAFAYRRRVLSTESWLPRLASLSQRSACFGSALLFNFSRRNAQKLIIWYSASLLESSPLISIWFCNWSTASSRARRSLCFSDGLLLGWSVLVWSSRLRFALHVKQELTQLSGLDEPPRQRGTTWSTVA